MPSCEQEQRKISRFSFFCPTVYCLPCDHPSPMWPPCDPAHSQRSRIKRNVRQPKMKALSNHALFFNPSHSPSHGIFRPIMAPFGGHFGSFQAKKLMFLRYPGKGKKSKEIYGKLNRVSSRTPWVSSVLGPVGWLKKGVGWTPWVGGGPGGGDQLGVGPSRHPPKNAQKSPNPAGLAFFFSSQT